MSELRKYQVEAVDFLLSHRRAILGDSPGTGKTPVALRGIEATGASPMLIVVPNSVGGQWMAEAGVWFPELRMLDGRGTAARRAQVRKQVAEGAAGSSCSSEAPSALLLSYESFRQDHLALAEIPWKAFLFDEGHRLKGRATQVTKASKLVVGKRPSSWCWLLTGTPVPNRPPEAWSLLNLLDRHRWPSYWRWVRNHCQVDRQYLGGRPIEMVGDLKPGHLEKVRDELADVLFQRPLEELLPHLPDVTVTRIPVDLEPWERKAYDELRRRGWTLVGEGEDAEVVQATTELAKITRLRQVTAAMDAIAVGEVRRTGAKICAALELARDLSPEPVIILTWSRAASERIFRSLVDSTLIHGGVPGQQREARLRGFVEGNYRVLVGTIDTLGEGVDGMQRAHHMIRLDRAWTPARNEQMIGRIRRSGQVSDRLVVWDVFARDSIDQHIADVVAKKEDVISALLGGRLRF